MTFSATHYNIPQQYFEILLTSSPQRSFIFYVSRGKNLDFPSEKRRFLPKET
ncbi:hypothetical protein BACPLE_00630 [Phocaeicola plebeius DSM 17135]|uniref:Uncharacterized protein n=1 Tax=Phocaeicola plebeius (strain DSM 17135 / JCM 12973 / CCUG 54634 / M2) TaxID=484018 RepID=B5CVA1_PHOPM|nr:hypothetical protein BACPLE_00630 [Phocaeicola plebeius DSM 17135]